MNFLKENDMRIFHMAFSFRGVIHLLLYIKRGGNQLDLIDFFIWTTINTHEFFTMEIS